MKISGYVIYSIVVTAIIYPVSGYWKWGWRLVGRDGLL